ncbi:MAG: hypothetical protein WCP57_06565 [Bacteroidota bacterium]
MKMLIVFERLWITAFGLSIFVAIFNLIKYKQFDNHVYMPIVCGILCIFLWRNLKSQREFTEKMNERNEDVDKNKSDESLN